MNKVRSRDNIKLIKNNTIPQIITKKDIKNTGIIHNGDIVEIIESGISLGQYISCGSKYYRIDNYDDIKFCNNLRVVIRSKDVFILNNKEYYDIILEILNYKENNLKSKYIRCDGKDFLWHGHSAFYDTIVKDPIGTEYIVHSILLSSTNILKDYNIEWSMIGNQIILKEKFNN